MIIGINCLEINPDYAGGINSFTFGLLDGFLKNQTEHSFNLFVTKKNKQVFEKYSSQKKFTLIEIPMPSDFFIKIEWKSIKFHSQWIYKIIKNIVYSKQIKLIDENCDVLYTPTTTILTYNSKVPNILSMHDIQQVHFPAFFSKLELLIRNITYNLSARNAEYLQVSSHFIKNDFLQYFSFLSDEQLIFINEGVDIEKFKNPDTNNNILSKYNIPDDFLFYPAQLWPHKNHITILKALHWLKTIRQISIPLVLCGANYSASEIIFKFISENKLANVYYLGKIPFDDVVMLYKQARFLICASLHESSCLPVLEAAAAGVPIIASDIPPNIEMSKSISMNLFSASHYVSLGNLIDDIWSDDNKIQKQIQLNYQSIEKYSWEKIAKKYISFFESIA